MYSKGAQSWKKRTDARSTSSPRHRIVNRSQGSHQQRNKIANLTPSHQRRDRSRAEHRASQSQGKHQPKHDAEVRRKRLVDRSVPEAKRFRPDQLVVEVDTSESKYFSTGQPKTANDMKLQKIGRRLASEWNVEFAQYFDSDNGSWVLIKTFKTAKETLEDIQKLNIKAVGIDLEYTHWGSERERGVYVYPVCRDDVNTNVVRLVQLAVPSVKEVIILDIDAIAADFARSKCSGDYAPNTPNCRKPLPAAFFNLLTDEQITKVVFSESEDQRVLQHTFGLRMKGVYDLQQEWKCVVNDLNVSITYKGESPSLRCLAEQLFDRDISKDSRIGLWQVLREKIELPKSILDYAAEDVRITLMAYELLDQVKTEMAKPDSPVKQATLLVTDSLLSDLAVNEAHVQKHSLSGAKLKDVLAYLKTLCLQQFERIIIQAGSNDLLNSTAIWDDETLITPLQQKFCEELFPLLFHDTGNQPQLVILCPTKVHTRRFVNQNLAVHRTLTEDGTRMNELVRYFEGQIDGSILHAGTLLKTPPATIAVVMFDMAEVNAFAEDGLHYSLNGLKAAAKQLNERQKPFVNWYAAETNGKQSFTRGTRMTRKEWQNHVADQGKLEVPRSDATRRVSIQAEVETITIDDDDGGNEENDDGWGAPLSTEQILCTVRSDDTPRAVEVATTTSKAVENQPSVSTSDPSDWMNHLPAEAIRNIQQMQQRIDQLTKQQSQMLTFFATVPDKHHSSVELHGGLFSTPLPMNRSVSEIKQEHLEASNVIRQLQRFWTTLIAKGGQAITWRSNLIGLVKMHMVKTLSKPQFNFMFVEEKMLIIETVADKLEDYFESRRFLQGRQFEEGNYDEVHLSASFAEFEYRRLHADRPEIMAIFG